MVGCKPLEAVLTRVKMKNLLLVISIVFALPAKYSISYDCPASCIVCMENATICKGLTYILATPLTTRALLLTDGLITSVHKSNLTRLSSLTLLTLSNNGIVNIKEDAFHGLSELRTLLLDQNEITKYAITESTFTGLSNLQTLQMDNNALSQINGTWFKHMVNLISLQLRGNQITKLEANIFRRSSLYNLQILDLSYNFISHIDRDAFQALRSLEHLDLSRNRLSVMPDSFSHLSKLAVLNLNLNHWNCTCELKELSLFLRNFVKSLDRTLINAKDLVCEATESSAIQTLFQLTEANCIPSSENITIILKNGVYRHYVRDIVLAAVFCFAGAVVLTVAIIAVILHKKHQQHIQPCQPTGANISNSSSQQNHIFKEFCNGYDNEVQVVSTVSSADEGKLLEQNIVGAKSREYSKQRFHEKSIGHLNQVNEISTESNHFMCHNCKLVHSFPVVSYGNMSTDNEVKRLAGHFSGVAREQREAYRCVSHRKDIQTKSPCPVPKFNEGIKQGRKPRYKHFDGSYCPLQDPTEKHYQENEYYKRVAEAKNANQSQIRRQIESQYNDTSNLSPTNKPQKSKTVALIADAFHKPRSQCLQENRAKTFQPLPGNHLIGNHEDQHRLIYFQDGIQVKVNKTTKTKHENNRNRRKLNEKLSDNVMRCVNSMDAKRDCFAEEEQRSKPKVRKTKQPHKQKVVTFNLPDFHENTGVELTSHATNSKEEGKGRTRVASSDGNRKLRQEKTHVVRPRTAGKRSHEKEKESDIEKASLDNISTGSGHHKMSKKKLMVKRILDPTMQATVCPDEATIVKQPLEENKQNTKPKTGSKESCKKVKTARKATARQSHSPPVNLIQHDAHQQKPEVASNYTLATSPIDTQCQLNVTSESGSQDRLIESNEKFHTVYKDKTAHRQRVAKMLQSDTTAYAHRADQREVNPPVIRGNDLPVISTKTNELINSDASSLSIPDINTIALQETQRSMESNEAPLKSSEMSGNTVVVKNMNDQTAPFSSTCPNDTAVESLSTVRTHVDDNAKKDTLLQLKPSTVGTIKHQNVTLDRNNRDLTLQNDQYSSQVFVIGEFQLDSRNTLKISERQEHEEEDYNKQSPNGHKGCEDRNQSQIEGSIQMPVSEEEGSKEHHVQTVNEQSGVRSSIYNKVIMKDTAPEVNMKEAEEENSLKSVLLLSGSEEAASSDNNQITGLEFTLKPVDLPSEDIVPHSLNDFRTQESLEECTMKPTSEMYLNPLPTEQQTSSSATSSVGPRLEKQDDTTSIIFNNPNTNNSSINASITSYLQATGVNKEQVSDVIDSNAEKPEKQSMVLGDPQPVNCNLLPIHNINILDEAGDQENQKTKIRIVIPEQPNGQSRNLHNRKIR